MWWFGLEDYLLQKKSININGINFDISNMNLKQEVFLKIREIIISKASHKISFKDVIESLGIIYNPRKYDKLTLKWGDIKYMTSKTKLCTIGCHTHSHHIFNNISDNEVIKDITKSKELFMKHLGFKPKHFAYPFGDKIAVNKRFFPLIKKLGFNTATTTRFGTIYSKHKEYLFNLPRVFFSENFVLESAFRIRRRKIIID